MHFNFKIRVVCSNDIENYKLGFPIWCVGTKQASWEFGELESLTFREGKVTDSQGTE